MYHVTACTHCLGPLEWWPTGSLPRTTNAAWICNGCLCIYGLQRNVIKRQADCHKRNS